MSTPCNMHRWVKKIMRKLNFFCILLWKILFNVAMVKGQSYTVEQEIFATGNFRDFGPYAIRLFVKQGLFLKLRTSSFQKFAKISCTRIAYGQKPRKSPVLQYIRTFWIFNSYGFITDILITLLSIMFHKCPYKSLLRITK